ncbi:hypothetical protein J2X55_002286 [Microbacterium sp. 1154]|uniref:hypothetical protein n=1 Tax=Microbacterium sp. 1154 TaxID=2817733 RepID=UPI00285BC179|nr:hypothetical protein [Microbacterium sp. 1154]MDR6691374.1 hypothetical protein [Microbacterium sp. 1154]
MNAFTASNGISVTPSASIVGGTSVNDVALHKREADALREFFQAEADERLGRWRWPENPAYVVAAYFDAHPEPKPWHGAEPGDVFLVTWPGSEREEAVIVPGAWPKAWECVTSARRIWPEVSS